MSLADTLIARLCEVSTDPVNDGEAAILYTEDAERIIREVVEPWERDLDAERAKVAALEVRLSGECETCCGTGVMTVDEGIESGHAPYDWECGECHGSGKGWLAEEIAAAKAQGAAEERERSSAQGHSLITKDPRDSYGRQWAHGLIEMACVPPQEPEA